MSIASTKSQVFQPEAKSGDSGSRNSPPSPAEPERHHRRDQTAVDGRLARDGLRGREERGSAAEVGRVVAATARHPQARRVRPAPPAKSRNARTTTVDPSARG